jgi:hypothetical protein
MPECDHIVGFNSGDNFIYKSKTKKKDKLDVSFIYCPSCGERINKHLWSS